MSFKLLSVAHRTPTPPNLCAIFFSGDHLVSPFAGYENLRPTFRPSRANIDRVMKPGYVSNLRVSHEILRRRLNLVGATLPVDMMHCIVVFKIKGRQVDFGHPHSRYGDLRRIRFIDPTKRVNECGARVNFMVNWEP